MTTTCDVPPSVESALAAIEATLSQALVDVATQRGVMEMEMATFEANVLEDSDALLAEIMNVSNRSDIRTVDDYRSAIGLSTASAESQLAGIGVNMANGRGILSSGTNVSALKQLWRLTGNNRTLFDSILAKDPGTFVIGVTYNRVVTVTVANGCGTSTVQETTVETVAGIDVSIESLEDTGIEPEDINIYTFWLEDSNSNRDNMMRFDYLGIDATSAAVIMNAARLPNADGTLPKVYDEADSSPYNLVTSVIIEEPGVLDRYANTDAGSLTDDERGAILEEGRALAGVDPDASVADWYADTGQAIENGDSGNVAAQLGTGRIANPALAVLADIDLGQTTGFDNVVAECRSGVLDDLMKSILSYFELAFGIMTKVLQVTAEAVKGIFDRVQETINFYVSLVGGTNPAGKPIDMLCLLGIAPFGVTQGITIPLDILDAVIDTLDAISDGIDAVLDAVLTLFGFMTTPICIIQSIIEMIFPPGLADCVGLDITFGLDSDCFNNIVGQMTKTILFVQSLIDKAKGYIASWKLYIKFALPGLGAQYKGGVKGCIGLSTFAFAAALEALG